jgi:hypothetical protein
MDNIAWGLLFIEDWSCYLSSDLLQKMTEQSLVPITYAVFTALFYTNKIIGCQERKINNLMDNACPLFVEMLRISELDYPFDIAQLGGDGGVRSTYISSFISDNCAIRSDYEYQGQVALVPEGNNRSLFLSSIAYSFFQIQDGCPGIVAERHRVEFACFNMLEVNGATLIVGAVEELLKEHWRTEVKDAFFLPTRGQFYKLLSKLMRQLKGGGKTNILSMNPRWQNVSQMLFCGLPGDPESVDLYILFVKREFNILCSGDGRACMDTRHRLTNTDARDKFLGDDLQTKKSVQLCVVGGTFGIHLGAYIGAIPATNTSFAAIEHGSSEFYLCVNHLLKDELGVEPLLTLHATEEVERMRSPLAL